MDDEGYDLIEMPEQDPMESDPSGLAEDALGPIDDDLPCRHCGYNLRGLSETGVCPECGTAVGRSLLSDRLRYSDPVWVRTLACGMSWILCGICLSILGGVLSLILVFALPSHSTIVMAATGSVTSLVSLVGYWYVTMPEPGELETEEITVRLFARWSLTASSLLYIAAQAVFAVDQWIVQSISSVGGLIGVAGIFALCMYAKRLALRVPEYRLANQTRIVMWGLAISLGLLLVSSIIVLLASSVSSSQTPAVVAAVPMCVAGLGYLVFAIWALVLTVWYHRVASAEADIAEQIWVRGI